MALLKGPFGIILAGALVFSVVYFIMLVVEILKITGANQTFGPGVFTYVLMRPLFWIIALGSVGSVIWFIRHTTVKG